MEYRRVFLHIERASFLPGLCSHYSALVEPGAFVAIGDPATANVDHVAACGDGSLLRSFFGCCCLAVSRDSRLSCAAKQTRTRPIDIGKNWPCGLERPGETVGVDDGRRATKTSMSTARFRINAQSPGRRVSVQTFCCATFGCRLSFVRAADVHCVL